MNGVPDRIVTARGVDELRLRELERKRSEMVAWLREEKGFSKKGAEQCADNFLASMAFVLEETGSLPA